MSDARMTRRRALLLLVGGAGALAGGLYDRGTGTEWTGTALGADARMIFAGGDPAAARDAIRACLAEIERLEGIFSLYREDAELVRLNAARRLDNPSLDLLQLLRQCRALHGATAGLFDPTVQPLWRLYGEWYAGGVKRALPPEAMTNEARALIGFERLEIGASRLALAPGSQLTLNGIAQGYITDRIAELLRRRGWSNILIDLGEVLAIGTRKDGKPFDIGLREHSLRLPLTDAALATSSVEGLVFSRESHLSHVIEPRSGITPRHWRSVTVRHASATVADGLSTALILAAPHHLPVILREFPGTQVWAQRPDGAVSFVSS